MWGDVATIFKAFVPLAEEANCGLGAFINKGKLSYLELAWDLPHVFSHYFWCRGYSRKSAKVGKQGNETIYLNKPNGAIQFVAYNKLIQLQTQKGLKLSNENIMRLEVRLKRKALGGTLSSAIQTFQNPLSSTRPFSKKQVGLMFPDLFEDAVAEGFQNALSDYTAKEKKAMLRKLDQHATPDWWEPAQMQNEMLKSMQHLHDSATV